MLTVIILLCYRTLELSHILMFLVHIHLNYSGDCQWNDYNPLVWTRFSIIFSQIFYMVDIFSQHSGRTSNSYYYFTDSCFCTMDSVPYYLRCEFFSPNKIQALLRFFFFLFIMNSFEHTLKYQEDLCAVTQLGWILTLPYFLQHYRNKTLQR